MIKIIKQTLCTQFVDDTTGEVFEETREFLDDTIKPKKKTSTRTKKNSDTDPDPKITLLEGKIQMNNACVELVGWEPEMKIDIRFEKQGRKITPIILEDETKGNRLTKTFTVSCRGSKHDNLAEYGTVFNVIPYEGHDGWFKLLGDAPEKEDDIIDVPEEITNPEDEVDVDEDGVEAADIDFNLDID